jgi:hypothetical protein
MKLHTAPLIRASSGIVSDIDRVDRIKPMSGAPSTLADLEVDRHLMALMQPDEQIVCTLPRNERVMS